MDPKIEVNYRSQSDDPEKNCAICHHFQAEPDSDDDGTCFGNHVVRHGLCNFFTETRPAPLNSMQDSEVG